MSPGGGLGGGAGERPRAYSGDKRGAGAGDNRTAERSAGQPREPTTAETQRSVGKPQKTVP